MARAILLLFAIPLAASFLFGDMAVPAAAIMLAAAALVGLQLLFLLHWLRRLDWWHACLAGALCGGAVALLYWIFSPEGHLAWTGAANAVLMIGFGTALGLVYWVAAIYRNDAFPYVPQRFPRAMLLVVPAVLLGAGLHAWLKPRDIEGRVLAVEPGANFDPARPRHARLRLRDGREVDGELYFDNEGMPLVGECVHLAERGALSRLGKIYPVFGFKLGEHYKDC